MKLILAFVLLFSSTLCKNTKIKDFPPDVQEDIFTMLMNGTVKIRNMEKSARLINNGKVTFWLSTREASQLVEIKDVAKINFKKQVIVLAHGWLGDRNLPEIKAIRDAHIKRYDASIITIDYKELANCDYYTAYHNLHTEVAKSFAEFLCDLNKKVSLDNVHVLGFSLGAQLAGLAGGLVKRKCKVIKRITGLDPAGPLFQFTPPEYRLDETDALFVDVIHTNLGQNGYMGRLGHIDFYPNCGIVQPGCPKLDNQTSIDKVLNVSLAAATCNHARSCYLFAESINNNSFYSTSCTKCGFQLDCSKDKTDQRYIYMGESCTLSPQLIQEYTLQTSAKPPYGLGPVGK